MPAVLSVSSKNVTIYDVKQPITLSAQMTAMVKIWIKQPTFSAVVEYLATKEPGVSKNRLLMDMSKLIAAHPLVAAKLPSKPDMSFAELKARAEAIEKWEQLTRKGLECPTNFKS